MAKKYHFNKETGRTGICDAKINCRLGLSQDEHFNSREEAQAAFEKTQDGVTSSIKNLHLKKMLKRLFKMPKTNIMPHTKASFL